MLGLGIEQYAIDRNEEAKQTLARFMTEYPASELIGFAHFWYGEITLREGDISTAEASLQKAAQNRAAPLVRGWYVSPQTWDSIAQYLLGWCSMLRNQYREALERFQAAAAAKPSGEIRSEVARSVGSLLLVCYRRARQSVSCWISTIEIHLRCMMWLEAISCGEIPKRASIWFLPLQERTAQHLRRPVCASDIPAKRRCGCRNDHAPRGACPLAPWMAMLREIANTLHVRRWGWRRPLELASITAGPDSGLPTESFLVFFVRWAADPMTAMFPLAGLIMAGLYWWLAGTRRYARRDSVCRMSAAR